MKDGYVLKIGTDGTMTAEKVDQDDLLHELQKLVSGSIEVVTLSKHRAMIVDEEGKLKRPCVLNAAATKLVRMLVPTMRQELIMGDALIVKIIPDDIAAYDLENYVRSTLRPAIESVINNSNKEKI